MLENKPININMIFLQLKTNQWYAHNIFSSKASETLIDNNIYLTQSENIAS